MRVAWLALLLPTLSGCSPDFDVWTFGASSSSASSSSTSSGDGGTPLPMCDSADSFVSLSAWTVVKPEAKIAFLSGNPAAQLTSPAKGEALLQRADTPALDACALTVRLVDFGSTSATAGISVDGPGSRVVVLARGPNQDFGFSRDAMPFKYEPGVRPEVLGFALNGGRLFVGYSDMSGWHLWDFGLRPDYFSKSALSLFADDNASRTVAAFDDYGVLPITMEDLANHK